MRYLSTTLPIIFIAVLALGALSLFPCLPMPPDGISAEKFDDFSGVLTIAIDDRLTEAFPGLTKWLTDITNLFEKHNRGMYLRCVNLPAARRDSALSGPQPADILLCLPGDAIQNRRENNMDFPLLPAFETGNSAFPIAAGGYILGIRGEIPPNLSSMPDGSIGWHDDLSTVWMALCEQFSPESTEKSTIIAPDIGLTPVETPEPAQPPATGTHFTRQNLFEDAPDALYARFLRGEISAMPLNERQAAEILTKPGFCLLNAASFTDRVAFAMIPLSARPDAQQRADAAMRFIETMLSGEAQARLSKYNLFPTAMTDAAYEGKPAMGAIESALRRSSCVVQRVDEPPISIDAQSFFSGSTSARELMRNLRNSR